MTPGDWTRLKDDLELVLYRAGFELVERDGKWLFPFPDQDMWHLAITPRADDSQDD